MIQKDTIKGSYKNVTAWQKGFSLTVPYLQADSTISHWRKVRTCQPNSSVRSLNTFEHRWRIWTWI